MSRAMRSTMLTDFGEPDDVASVVRFLASAESRFMSGTDVYADGGARTVWIDFPKKKSVPLPPWLRQVVE